MRAIVIAGTHSGCGKTTVSLGIMAAFAKKGYKVQPFKCGPDFIDSGLHKLVTATPSRNLDLWMCGNDYVRDCLYKYSANADISIIEGVMGMYDGQFSTASLANLLKLPLILVVDAYGMAESAGAIVKGFMEYQSSRTAEQQSSSSYHIIAGVIFNRVASERHFRSLKDSVRGVRVLGYLPRNLDFEIPHRHLGLTVAEENPLTGKNIERLADAVLEYIDVDEILNFAQQSSRAAEQQFSNILSSTALRIAIAYDRAFCFYYEDNLDLLKAAGVEIITFSPLSDLSIPDDIDAIYIGGGYPELYAERLSKNHSMLKAIYEWSDSGKPIYAECGGMMYLSKGIYDLSGNFFMMSGVFPFETSINLKRRAFLGYREVTINKDCFLGKKDDILRGHEFHYSEIKDLSRVTGIEHIYTVKDNKGIAISDEGFMYKNTLASYIHIHFGSNPGTANNFVNFIRRV